MKNSAPLSKFTLRKVIVARLTKSNTTQGFMSTSIVKTSSSFAI